jgi:hypothetical protein
MAAPSSGDRALPLWNDDPGSDEQAFNDWQDRSHIPEPAWLPSRAALAVRRRIPADLRQLRQTGARSRH